jgi:hypothetical protein
MDSFQKHNICTQNYWVFGLYTSSGILENMTFRKLDLFLSSGEGGGEDTSQLGPLERANLNYWIEWSRLALSNGPNWVSVFLLTWGQKQIQFPKRRVL